MVGSGGGAVVVARAVLAPELESVAMAGAVLTGVDASILNMTVTSNWPDDGRVDSAVFDARLLRSNPI